MVKPLVEDVSRLRPTVTNFLWTLVVPGVFCSAFFHQTEKHGVCSSIYLDLPVRTLVSLSSIIDDSFFLKKFPLC